MGLRYIRSLFVLPLKERPVGKRWAEERLSGPNHVDNHVDLGDVEKNGALKKTRTSTSLRTQIPETCASTNSAMRATQRRYFGNCGKLYLSRKDLSNIFENREYLKISFFVFSFVRNL